jgi:hypothetical protein
MVQPNKQDRPDRPNIGVLTLADFFNILLSDYGWDIHAKASLRIKY